MELYILAVVVGFALLVWGADRFVVGAAATADCLGVPPLVIGLTIVGFGTSAPEILVSAMAAWQGNTGLSIGNAVGSNIANIALVLGAGALLRPMAVHSRALRRELPVLIIIMFAVLALLIDGNLSRTDGLIMMVGLAVTLFWITKTGIDLDDNDSMVEEVEEEIRTDLGLRKAILFLVFGLVILLISSHMLVWGASEIALLLGISDLIIGLTIVALGTSLPELATTIVSSLKREDDIAIGNIIGSNIFNLLAVLSMPGLIHPGSFATGILTRDYPVMVVLTLALFVMAYSRSGTPQINRAQGFILLLSYATYQGLLYFTATGSFG